MSRKVSRRSSREVRQLTLRGLDAELQAVLERVAREDDVSLNGAALKLLRKGAGLSERRARLDVIGSALDGFIGTMDKAEARRILAATSDFDRIDDAMWR
jgi:hypothetical protein